MGSDSTCQYWRAIEQIQVVNLIYKFPDRLVCLNKCLSERRLCSGYCIWNKTRMDWLFDWYAKHRYLHVWKIMASGRYSFDLHTTHPTPGYTSPTDRDLFIYKCDQLRIIGRPYLWWAYYYRNVSRLYLLLNIGLCNVFGLENWLEVHDDNQNRGQGVNTNASRVWRLKTCVWCAVLLTIPPCSSFQTAQSTWDPRLKQGNRRYTNSVFSDCRRTYFTQCMQLVLILVVLLYCAKFRPKATPKFVRADHLKNLFKWWSTDIQCTFKLQRVSWSRCLLPWSFVEWFKSINQCTESRYTSTLEIASLDKISRVEVTIQCQNRNKTEGRKTSERHA